ncbi:MAG: hypothetical protein MUF73_17550 [Rhodobacteraceae bacterium]|nr:hypothetical protein [Paracoccaceae bacterium]
MLCALALALVALAPRPVVAGAPGADAQIAAYLASGGTLADLCLSDAPGDMGGAHADCPACTLTKGLAVAPACTAAPVLLSAAVIGTVWPETQVLTGHGPRAPPARGPPSIPLI